jgi:hypothetical protein
MQLFNLIKSIKFPYPFSFFWTLFFQNTKPSLINPQTYMRDKPEV